MEIPRYRVWEYERKKFLPTWRLMLDGMGNLSKKVDVIGGYEATERVEDIADHEISFELCCPNTDKDDRLLHMNDIVQFSDNSYGVVVYDRVVDSDGYKQEGTHGWAFKLDKKYVDHPEDGFRKEYSGDIYNNNYTGIASESTKLNYVTLVGNTHENADLLTYIKGEE